MSRCPHVLSGHKERVVPGQCSTASLSPTQCPMSPQGMKSGQLSPCPFAMSPCPCVTVPAPPQGTKSESGVPAGARALSHCPCVLSAVSPRPLRARRGGGVPGGAMAASHCPCAPPRCPRIALSGHDERVVPGRCPTVPTSRCHCPHVPSGHKEQAVSPPGPGHCPKLSLCPLGSVPMSPQGRKSRWCWGIVPRSPHCPRCHCPLRA